MRPVELVLDRIEGVRSNGDGYVALCPAHDDKQPSLSVAEGDNRRALIKCFAGCEPAEIVAALGLELSDLFEVPERNGKVRKKTVATYDYRDTDEQLLYQTVRYEPKGFSQRRPDGQGGWEWNLKGVEPVLYRLPKVVQAVGSCEMVFVTEGEKDADRLTAVGLVATTAPMGAGKWRSSYSQSLRGANVIIIPDNDAAGRKHAELVTGSLTGKAASIKVLELPNLPDGGDVSDWLDAGGDAEELERLAREASEWILPKPKVGGDLSDGSLGTFTAADLLAAELPPVRWAVPGLVPEGVTLLAGKAKMGKSWLTLGLCIAIATGSVALGKVPVERGEVLYLALEDNKRRLHKRLGKLLDGETPPAGLHIALDWPQLDRSGAEKLDRFLQEHPDTRLVVVDTLKKIRPRASGNRSFYDMDYEALEPLLPLAAEHRVAILVVHHLRKMDADDPLDAMSGSTGLSGGVDGALVLKRERGRADAYLYVTGREIEKERELALTWDAGLASWAIAGNANEYRMSESRTAIARVIEERGEFMTPTDVADALGVQANTVKQRMWRMAKDGQLISQDGRYSIIGNRRNPITE